jgi:hypothetical protein
MKELPYFKFSPMEYSDADISFLSYAHQGLFVKICCLFWSRDCKSISEGMLKQRFSDASDMVEQLLMSGILKTDGEGVFVSFLREQFLELSEKHSIKVENGRKGGLSSAQARLKQGSSNKDKDKDKDNTIKTWKNDFPTYYKECCLAYADFIDDEIELEKQEELNPRINVRKSIDKGFHNFWGTEAGWKHKKKSRVASIDWKSTIINSISLNKVWFTPKEIEERGGE